MNLSDKVLVAAVVVQRWRSCYPGARCDLELVLMANNILVLSAKKATVEVGLPTLFVVVSALGVLMMQAHCSCPIANLRDHSYRSTLDDLLMLSQLVSVSLCPLKVSHTCCSCLNRLSGQVRMHAAEGVCLLVQVLPEAEAQFKAFWEVHQERPWAGRDKLLQCLCPQIQGMPLVKLAALLMLIGGVARTDASGTSIRGQVHMLIVGDPGTGAPSLTPALYL